MALANLLLGPIICLLYHLILLLAIITQTNQELGELPPQTRSIVSSGSHPITNDGKFTKKSVFLLCRFWQQR